MSTVSKKIVNDVAVLMYKNYTQMAISIELNIPLEQVRAVQSNLANGEEINRKYALNVTTLNNIRKIEDQLFKAIEEWQQSNKTDFRMIDKINDLKYMYSTAIA